MMISDTVVTPSGHRGTVIAERGNSALVQINKDGCVYEYWYGKCDLESEPTQMYADEDMFPPGA